MIIFKVNAAGDSIERMSCSGCIVLLTAYSKHCPPLVEKWSNDMFDGFIFKYKKKQIKKEETGNSFEGKYFSTCDELTPDSVYVLQDGDRLLEID